MTDFIPILLVSFSMGIICWYLGYWYGIGTHENRNKQLIDRMERYTAEMELFETKPNSQAFAEGYHKGVQDTIAVTKDVLTDLTGNKT